MNDAPGYLLRSRESCPDDGQPVCPRCRQACETYLDEYTPTQNYPSRKQYIASKCCDAVLPDWTFGSEP